MPLKPRRISDIKPLLTDLAQTSHYEVQFNGLPPDGALKTYLERRGIDQQFVTNSVGILCYDAILPTTSLATVSIEGNYIGIQEKFAHTRMYDDITLSFYVDRNYKVLNFLEYWMEFIASGSFNPVGLGGEQDAINQNDDAFFIRMQYPAYYKCDAAKIIKFDRDYKKEIEYNFRGLYPKNISSIPVNYTTSDTLKVSATFSYDRYIAGKSNSLNQYVFKDNNNQDPKQSPNTINNSQLPQSSGELLRKTEEPLW